MLGRERPWEEPRFIGALSRKRSTWHGCPPGAPAAISNDPEAARKAGDGSPSATPPHESDALLPKGGYRSSSVSERLRNLQSQYGMNLLMLVFNVQHIMKGFVVNFTVLAEQFLYRAYSVPATEMQAYQAVTALPWSLKPIIGLVSDVFPVFGYNKAPYAFVTSLAGTAAFVAIGLLPSQRLPEFWLVLCLVLCSMQVATADILTQGKVTSRVNDAPTPMLRSDLLTFTWSGADVCALVAVISSGFVIHYYGARSTYIIAAVPGATFIVLVARGCYEECRVSREELREIRRRFWEQLEACMLSVLILCGAIVIICSTTISKSFLVHGIVSLCVAGVVLFSFSFWLTPVIAKMNAFNFLYAIVSLSIDAASYYFFTDTVEQYPEGPHLSIFFYTTVRGAVQFACSFIGVYSYQCLSHGWSYRRWLVMSTFLFAIVNVLNVLMFKRINIRIGVSDELWILTTTALVSIVDKWRWMPRMVSICYMSPKGMESTLFALLMGCHNLGWSISANVGAMLLSHLGISPSGAPHESAQFANLWVASVWGSVVPPVMVVLLCFLAPDVRQDMSLVGESRDAATAGSLWRALRGRPSMYSRQSVFMTPRRRSTVQGVSKG